MSDEQRLRISLGRKGIPSHRKGKPLSPEWRAKFSAARKCHSGPNKGKTFSVEYRAKLSAAHKGIPRPDISKLMKGKPSWNKGKSSHWMIGDKNPRWKGGITPKNRLLRESVEYVAWRTAIFERDAFTCQHCGQIGGKLQADHIRLWSKHPELRFDISNGQTLCKPCHRIKTSNDLKEHWVNQYPKPVNVSVSYR